MTANKAGLLAKIKAKKEAKEAREKAQAKDRALKEGAITDKAGDVDLTRPASDLIKTHLAKGQIEAEKLDEGAARQYLMWVGNDHYPTIEHFVREARKMGVSKRLNMVTPHLVPGVTRIYLAHNGWYETSARFLTTKDNKGQPVLVDGIEVPQISRMKSLRRLGMMVKAKGLDHRACFDDLVRGKGPAYEVYYDDLNEAAIWRLLEGEEKDPVLVPLVEAKAKAITDKGWDRLVKHSYGRASALYTTVGKLAACMAVAADYVDALDAGKGVFGYFLLECLEYILPRGEKLPDYLDRQTVEVAGKKVKDPKAQAILNLISKADGGLRDDALPKICRVVREEDEPSKHYLAASRRGCGYRKPGGVYAVSSKQAKPRGQAKGLGVAGPLYLAHRPVQAEGLDYFRGIRSIPEKIEKVIALEMMLRGAKKSN